MFPLGQHYRAMVVTILVISLATSAHASITISITSPSANHVYGAVTPPPPIDYGGSMSLTAPEKLAIDVYVELVWSTQTNPPFGSGVTLDAEYAIGDPWVFTPPPPAVWTTATADWYTSSNPSTLNAIQYQGNQTGYWIRATPKWKQPAGFYYNPPGSGSVVCAHQPVKIQ